MMKRFILIIPLMCQTGKVAFLVDGTQLKASYTDDEKGTYLFDTEVLNKVKGNIPMMQLLLPPEETFIKIQRRQFVRIDTSVDIAIHPIEGAFVPFRAVTDDLSAGGAAIRLKKNIKSKRCLFYLYLVGTSLEFRRNYLPQAKI